MEADDVRVALAHDDLVLGDDVCLGPVQPVQGSALGVDHRLRRVLVLRRIRRAGQYPPAEGDRIAGVGEDREQHAGAERVLQAVALVGEREAGVAQQVGGNAEIATHRVPVVGCPAELELAGDVAGQPAPAQVLAGLAGVGRRQQPLVIPIDRLRHCLDELTAADPLFVLAPARVAQLDARLRSE